MFQIKDFASVTASMINHCRGVTKKITDFNVGSVVRTIMEAVAIEIDELYQQMFIGLKEAIPVATYTSFGFERLEAAASAGLLQFTASPVLPSNLTVPAGTQVKSVTGRAYFTASDVVLLAGQASVTARAVCAEPGIVGNTAASTITQLVGALPGITAITNPAAFTTGRDEETDAEIKTRFQGYVSTLARGTPRAVAYGARQAQIVDTNGVVTEYVARLRLIEPYIDDNTQPIALVQLYIHNGSGSTSSALITEVAKVVDGYYLEDGSPVPGWKAAGVVVEVYAAAEVAVNVTGMLTVSPGYLSSSVLAQATAAVSNYLINLEIGDDVVYAQIIEDIMAVPGVYDVALTAPTSNMAVARDKKAWPGTIGLAV